MPEVMILKLMGLAMYSLPAEVRLRAYLTDDIIPMHYSTPKPHTPISTGETGPTTSGYQIDRAGRQLVFYQQAYTLHI